jgi:pyridoxal phosphate enzyme (YggS family)
MRRKLAENLKRVRERIETACDHGGRQPEDVRLVAVTKTVEVDVIRAVIESGLLELGENRAQELVKRAGMINEHLSRRRKLEPGGVGVPSEPRWHMIGHLQRNKVKSVLPWVSMIHSLDSLRLAEEISKEAQRLDISVPVLVQVNVAGEKSKHGIAVGATSHLTEHIRTLPGLKIAGLMTMAPLTDDPEETRPCFRRLREIAEDMRHERVVGPEFTELCMGMTNDFEVAVEEGATMVRLGRALFDGITEPV